MKLLKELQAALENGDTTKAKEIAAAIEQAEKKPKPKAKKKVVKRKRIIKADTVLEAETVISKIKEPKLSLKSGGVKADNKKMIRLGDIIDSDPEERVRNKERARIAAKFKMVAQRKPQEFSLKKITCKKCKTKFNPNSYIDHTLNKTLCKDCQMDN